MEISHSGTLAPALAVRTPLALQCQHSALSKPRPKSAFWRLIGLICLWLRCNLGIITDEGQNDLHLQKATKTEIKKIVFNLNIQLLLDINLYLSVL
jgi:hypothetical protein